MSTTVTVLEQQKARLDPDMVLGHLMWYGVHENTMIDHGIMVQALTQAGFTRALPNAPKDHNIFARVTTDAQRRNIERPNGTYENWLVRDVAGRAEKIITRRVVLELRDPRGKKLDYHPIADVNFHRTNGKITFSFLPEFSTYCDSLEPDEAFRVLNTANAIAKGVRSEYTRWRGQMNDAALRHWISNEILEMGGVSVKPYGGLYFLRQEYAKDVDALVEVFTSFGNDCHALPLIDDLKQREMLRKAVEADTNGEIDKLMVEIKNVKAEGKLTPQKFEAILLKGKRLRAQTGDYAHLLETALGEIDSRLTMLTKMTLGLSSLQQKRTRKPKE